MEIADIHQTTYVLPIRADIPLSNDAASHQLFDRDSQRILCPVIMIDRGIDNG